MRSLIALVAVGLILTVAGTAGATTVDQPLVSLYVDAAPNAYGSPAWPAWWASTEADVVGGTFTDMRSGAFPGTTSMILNEEIVYSTGDLGQRLTWIYWVPNTTVDALAAQNFQVKIALGWDGTTYALDWDSGYWLDDGADVGWATPSNWANYNGGVIGSFGLGFWAVGADGNPADVTPADIEAMVDSLSPQTNAIGEVRVGNVNDALNVTVVPEPITMAGLMLGIGGLVGYVRRRARK